MSTDRRTDRAHQCGGLALLSLHDGSHGSLHNAKSGSQGVWSISYVVRRFALPLPSVSFLFLLISTHSLQADPRNTRTHTHARIRHHPFLHPSLRLVLLLDTPACRTTVVKPPDLTGLCCLVGRLSLIKANRRALCQHTHIHRPFSRPPSISVLCIAFGRIFANYPCRVQTREPLFGKYGRITLNRRWCSCGSWSNTIRIFRWYVLVNYDDSECL